MQENTADISAASGTLFAISSDSISLTKATVDRDSLTFTVLSDNGLGTIGDYNVVDRGNTRLARPSVFIIKTDGTIGWKSLDSTYSRTSAATIISTLNSLD